MGKDKALSNKLANMSLKPGLASHGPPPRSRKIQKKARKLLLAKELSSKQPHTSKRPGRQVAKNTLSQARMKESMARRVENIILTVSAPKEFPPERLGSTFGSYPTALANPFKVLDTKSTSFINNTMMAFVFRDPRRFLIYPRSVPYSPISPAPIWSTYSYSFAGNGYNIGAVVCPLPVPPLTWVTSEASPHGPVLYPGRCKESQRSFFWVSAGSDLVVTNINSANLGINLYAYVLNIDGSCTQHIPVFGVASGAQGFITPSVSGYYGYDIGTTLPTTFLGSVSVNEKYSTVPTSLVTMWCHQSVPDLNKADEAAEAIKLYGASLMWTNQASPLNRQGKIAAVQIPQGRDWRNFRSFDTISVQRGAYTSNAVNGYYGFLKPTQPHDIDFIENNIHTNGNFVSGWWDAEIPSDYLALSVSVTDVDGQDGYITVAAALEFRTADQWRDTEDPKASPEMVMKAMSIVSRLPQHHENPLHLSDIWGAIKGFMNDMWEGIKEAVPVVANVASKTASIAMAIAPLL